MSLANDAKLLLIPSGYKSGKVYSVFPTSGDGDFSFSRYGNASRINEGGYIETEVSNVPRIDHFGGECPSLLLEPFRQNLQIRSQEFNDSAWTKTNCTITADNEISPENLFNADKMQRTSTSGSYVYDFIYVGYGAKTYTSTVFVKQGVGDFFSFSAGHTSSQKVDLQFQFSTKQIISYTTTGSFLALNSKVEEFSNGWFRLFITYTTQGGSSGLLNYFSARSTAGNYLSTDINTNANCYLFGAQVELAAYGSSYIATTSSTVSRIQDFCTNGGDADLFNITEGTFYVDVTPYNNSVDTVIGLSSGSDTQRIMIQFRSNNTQIRLFSSGGASFYANLTFEQRNKIAVTFKLNEYKIYINGAFIGSDTSSTVPIGMDRLNFSNSVGNGSGFEGKVHDTRVYNKILTEAESIQLTTL